MNKSLLTLTLISSAALLNGCATVTGNTDQNIVVETQSKNGEPLTGAVCKLANDRGSWKVHSPDMAMVRKSGGDLTVICEKPGHEIGITKAVSKANAGMFGNIILGGGIGAVIDHSKGTAYNYPSVVKVVMGETHSTEEKKILNN